MNNVELGRHGRSCSNVWNYRGVNTFGGAGRMEELRSHPTVTPVALVADAMRDCTRRRDIVLDTFSGSGTTITRSEALRRHRQRRSDADRLDTVETDRVKPSAPRRKPCFSPD